MKTMYIMGKILMIFLGFVLFTVLMLYGVAFVTDWIVRYG